MKKLMPILLAVLLILGGFAGARAVAAEETE